mgnify:CR=1 FL=1|tara:strand:- start:67 stop:498 length:432 start_codon:yes stop_codon:yes gene_type:complete
MPIKSFRGLITDNTQDTISLHTNDGSTGYRIKTFQVVHENEADDLSATIKIFSIPQTAQSATIDFSDQTLLAACAYRSNKTDTGLSVTTIVFDNMTFNQDIYITYRDNETADKEVNYYIELEQIKLDLNENTVATLKDIRNLA